MKWEYKIIPILTELKQERAKEKQLPKPLKGIIFSPISQEELLNQYGSEGWELVSVLFLKNQNRIEFLAYLKRQMEQ